jgi:hypothetical protein
MQSKMKIISLVQDVFVHQRIMSAAEFVSDWVSCIVLRSCRCARIGLKSHALTEDKSDDLEAGFCEELKKVFFRFQCTL